MAKFVSPLLGYNNNVRHKGRVFHIQTEDSGVNHPHIITHLFMDGGRILKSVKKSYAEHVGADGMSEIVRQMMKEQHKAMFIALRDGQFDHIVDPNAAQAPAAAPAVAAPPAAAPAPAPAPAAPSAAAAAPPPPPAPASAAPPPPPEVEPKKPSARPEPAPAAVVRSVPPSPAAISAPPPQTAAARIASTPRLVLASDSSEEAPMTTPEPRKPDAAPSVKELTLDFDALERASHDAGAGPSLFHAADLPPPPKNLFSKERGTGAYRAVEEDARVDPRAEPSQETTRIAPNRAPSQHPPHQPGQRPAAASPRTPAAPPARPAGNEGGRYAPARPAAIFGAAAKPAPQSLFSDELVSDKSLDEVILSYLAEDLEPPRRK